MCMQIQKRCDGCGGAYSNRCRTSKFCSKACYHKKVWRSSGVCVECSKPSPLARFCSRRCHHRFHSHRTFLKAKERRLRIIAMLGNKCVRCGFADQRALEIHHKDRGRKSRGPNDRSLTRRVANWRKNMDHIEVLCANCHRIDTCENVWKACRTRKEWTVIHDG